MTSSLPAQHRYSSVDLPSETKDMSSAYETLLQSHRQKLRARLGASSLKAAGGNQAYAQDYAQYEDEEYPQAEEVQPSEAVTLTLRQRILLRRRLRQKQLLRQQQLAAVADYDYGEDISRYGVTGSGYGAAEPSVQVVYQKKKSCYTGLNLAVAFALAAATALAFYFVFIQVTMGNGNRRSLGKGKKRSKTTSDDDDDDEGTDLNSLFWIGLEEFEDKVDKLASGDGDENSWIGNLYNKFKGSFMGDIDNSIVEEDGLEPPILDDKWGLGDVHKLYSENNNSTLAADNSTMATNGTEHAIAKRSLEDEDVTIDDDEDDEFVKGLVGESKCRTKFWRCVGKVAKGSLHHMQEPGGLSGAFQKTMFRMAFHGGFGNVWNALMTIPEARNVKRCMNAQEECMNYEALHIELDATSKFASEHTGKQRLIVNPEMVENQDPRDGAEQFDEDIREMFENGEF